MSRLGDWVGRNMPTREQMEGNRYLRPFAHRVLAPELWRFTRRSVPRGVALGTLVGIIVPFGQIFFAAILALPVRANVPVAALTTFVTNPITTPFIWVASYEVGRFILRIDALTYGRPVATATQYGYLADALQWVTGMGPILAFGLVVVAVVSASIGYLVSLFMWSTWVRQKRQLHLKARLARVIDLIDGD
ncbi:MAG: DUF2062 domain-containing protein [Pseudomonadota bacterium]